MPLRTLLLMLLAGVALTGCGQMKGFKADAQSCNAANCSISVTVSSCVVSAPDLDLRGNTKGDITIQWTISTPGYTFSLDPLVYAIFLKSGNPHSAFHTPSVSGNVLTVPFKKGVSGKHQHQYGLNVVAADGTPCATADPLIFE